MIFAKEIENSVVSLLSAEFPSADIFRNRATQSRKDKEVFVVSVETNATIENKDYQRKDVTIIVQFFIDDKIKFNEDFTHIRDLLLSKIFINSIPIVDNVKKVVKHLLIKGITSTVVDDVLAIRVVTDYVDDVIVTNKTYDLIGTLHLNKGC